MPEALRDKENVKGFVPSQLSMGSRRASYKISVVLSGAEPKSSMHSAVRNRLKYTVQITSNVRKHWCTIY